RGSLVRRVRSLPGRLGAMARQFSVGLPAALRPGCILPAVQSSMFDVQCSKFVISDFDNPLMIYRSPCAPRFTARQSRRDCVPKPSVARPVRSHRLPGPKVVEQTPSHGARNELPWVEGRTLSNPERVPAWALNT